VNVRRVLSRAARGTDELPFEETRRVSVAWLAVGDAYRWNQALMDIGAMICRIDAPLCTKCPLRSSCVYYQKGLNTRASASRAPKQSPFEGSRRQKRGGIIDHLREAAEDGVSLSELARAIHPDSHDRDLSWLVELLEGLQRDGLIEMTPGARRGSPRGIVRLPG
jgi:A/G-specific adenine glycosylase